MNRLNLLAICLWLIIGIYGIFYNHTYIDEAKYLIKGWLITTGQVGYYTTPEFFYQHMPGGLLWFGLGQKLVGPNLLIARIQSWILGLLILWFSVKLAKTIHPQAGRWILPIMVLAPVITLYYSSAVPQALAALALILGFYFMFKDKNYLATVWFTLAFIVRENFLFTLFFYLLFQKKLRHWLIALIIILVWFIPGWPGILNIFKNFPGISWLLPVSAAEKTVLALNFQQQNHSLALYLQAVKEFIEIYGIFLLALAWAFRQKYKANRQYIFLCLVTGFNFLAHAWSAFNLSPRAVVPYFAYIFPLVAIIAAVRLGSLKLRWLMPLVIIAPATIIFSSLFQRPSFTTTLAKINHQAEKFSRITSEKQKILWLANPMPLYLAGKISFYPLINHYNFYKPTDDTATVRKLGFWNQALFDEWVAKSQLIMIDYDRLPPGLNLENLPPNKLITLPEASPWEK